MCTISLTRRTGPSTSICLLLLVLVPPASAQLFNPTVTVTLEQKATRTSHELVHGQTINWRGGQTDLTLDGEDVAVIQMN